MAGELIAPITNGKPEETDSANKPTKKSNSELGKDDFLQLLVAQMKYQDPLNPSSDTEFISQLAQFSSLEQMQNLNLTTQNTQAFSLVGQEVILTTEDATGTMRLVQGTVDYVTLRGSKTFLSIDGNEYSMDDLYTVVNEDYIAGQKAPSVTETILKYDHQNPEDVKIKISLGEDEYRAGSVGVIINSKVIDAEKYLDFEPASGIDDDPEKDIILTIKKEAFQRTDGGVYPIAFLFDDINQTIVADKVIITITGEKPDLPPEEEEGDGENGNGTGGNGTS